MVLELRKVTRAMFLDFAVNTGIHGIKYITERGRRPVERLLWILVVACGLVGAIFMASNFWTRFTTSPTRASVETNHYPTWRIPFPAVTLCNANRIFRSKAEQLVDSMKLPAHMNKSVAMEHMAFLQELVQLIPERGTPFDLPAAQEFQHLLEAHNHSLRELMTNLDQGCEELLDRCMWKGALVNCSELFEERKCYIGFCCAFNYRGLVENTTKDGSKQLVEVQRRVEHTRYYNHRMGLSVLLNPAVHDYFLSTLFSAGVRMLIHDSDDYPDDTVMEKILPVGRELLLQVTATSSYCTDGVRDVRPDVRGCVFPEERKLRYFPVYSATNCLTECRMNYSNLFCQCTPFYYHEVGEFKLCQLEDIPCLNKHFFTLRTRRASTVAAWSLDDHKNSSIECDCPALCNDVSYDVQFSSGDFKAAKFQRSKFMAGANVTDRILFHFYFGNHVSTRTRRDVINSWNDLLSSLGGVFSLFLGCSFMSVIEIFYFFTLRLFMRYRNEEVCTDSVPAPVIVRTVSQPPQPSPLRLPPPPDGIQRDPAYVHDLPPSADHNYVIRHRFF